MTFLLLVSLLMAIQYDPITGIDRPENSSPDWCVSVNCIHGALQIPDNSSRPPADDTPGECSISFCDPDCEPTPGEVDRCSFAWELSTNPAVLDLLDSFNPVCSQAITHNLEELTRFYGKSPQISVPNAALLRRLANLEVPLVRPLADEDGNDIAEDDPQQPLLSRIREARGRMSNLYDRISRHESFVATSAVWADTLKVGQRLDSRAAGLDEVLSAAATWPAIETFARATWDLVTCNIREADYVAELKRRIETKELTSVWSFAFGEDWVAFARTFGSSGLDRFESLSLPFFVEDSEVAAERQERTLFTQRDVREFRMGVADLVGEIELMVAERRAQQSASIKAMRTAFAAELAYVPTLHAALDARAEPLGAKKDELDQATLDRDRLAADIDRQQASIAEADRQLAVLREASRSARANHERARAATVKARERRDAAQAQLEAIVLDCDGADYASCPDQAAKLDYDRRRYEAQEVLSVARQEFMERLTQEIDYLEAVGEAERQVVDQEAAASDLRTALGDMLARVGGTEELVSRLESEWRQMEAEILPLRSAMSDLDQAVASIRTRLEAH